MIATSCGSGSLWAKDLSYSSLSLQGVQFEIQASGDGSTQELTISAKDVKRTYQTIRQNLTVRLVGAEVADLNSNGKPEIYVFVETVDGHIEVVAYSVINSNLLSPIYLQELSGQLLNGYRGHDEFQVVEECLARRFPIYKQTDSNTNPTGGLRQICYRLQNGESSFILRPTNVMQF